MYKAINKDGNTKTVHRGTRVFMLKDNTLFYNGLPVKVKENFDYTYKINKTCISAQGGATGLYNFIEDCILNSFGLVWIDSIESAMKRITTDHGNIYK